MSDTTTVGLRIDHALLKRIDHAAAQQGLNRTQYILSWLPVYYDSPAETKQNKAQQGQRVSRAAKRSSSTRG